MKRTLFSWRFCFCLFQFASILLLYETIWLETQIFPPSPPSPQHQSNILCAVRLGLTFQGACSLNHWSTLLIIHKCQCMLHSKTNQMGYLYTEALIRFPGQGLQKELLKIRAELRNDEHLPSFIREAWGEIHKGRLGSNWGDIVLFQAIIDHIKLYIWIRCKMKNKIKEAWGFVIYRNTCSCCRCIPWLSSGGI